MAFAIAHPIGKPYVNPTRLPHKFVAVGTKAAGETAAGFLLSVDSRGIPNLQLLIGGTPIPAFPSDNTKWALRFDITGVRPGVRFELYIYDKDTLPTAIAELVKLSTAAGGKAGDAKAAGGKAEDVKAADAKAVTRRNPERFFAAVRPNEKVGPTVAKVGLAPGRDERGVFSPEWVYPESNGSAPADLFVAYGDLPSGDSGIVINGTVGTRLLDTATGNHICPASYQDGDGQTFWAAFFPAINKTTYPVVDLKVVYSTSNSVEVSEEIVLE